VRGEAQTLLLLHLSMAANGSSANTANIITALGNAFKDPSGASMSNDRLAAVLLQNMNQLNDLAKQGKLNQQQIMQVRRDTCTKLRSYRQYLYPFTTSYGTMQTSTSPRQSRYVTPFPRAPSHQILILTANQRRCARTFFVSCSPRPARSLSRLSRPSRRRRAARPPRCWAKTRYRRTHTRSARP